MADQIFTQQQAYSFLKAEEYFSRYKDWEKLLKVESHSFAADKNTLTLNFLKSDGKQCSMLLQFILKNTVRFRFNPGKTAAGYTPQNSRSVVQDSLSDLQSYLAGIAPFTLKVGTTANTIELITADGNNAPGMKVVVACDPFSIKVYMSSAAEEFPVWQTAEIPYYYTPNGNDDYAIIQAVNKPATAKYIGFGEQGGQSLVKNTTQANFFNFDNMRYQQVYNHGPLDPREPLYHSDPFFFEFNGNPGHNTANGIFIDNTGQILVDIGYINSSRYMFGTRFGDLDFFLFTGWQPAEILSSFTALVGKSRLKPRYCLGYHQGCYGYENRESLEWVVGKYRSYRIPLDGLHVDVDFQDRYQTFTINQTRFPDPAGMFAGLRKQGVKCSTNITPVISNQDPNYTTYAQAKTKNYFVKDIRYAPDDPGSKKYQCYGGGNPYQPNQNDWVEGFNSGEPYMGGVNYGGNLGTTGHYADLGRKDVRFWWGTQYQYLFDMGLEMVWQDMTTPAIQDLRGDMKGFPFRLYVTDNSLSGAPAPQSTPAIKVWNLYSYNLHKATYHGLNNLNGRENRRNFIIGRGCFTGSHRFAGLWTGDNSSDWDFLKMNVSQVLSLGMCGLDLSGQDIGGFESGRDNGQWASPELLIRWTCAGAFLPWFRNHYVRKGRKEFQEPFMYVEWFNQYRGGNLPEPRELYRMVLPVCRHYIELRYRLLQLFYDVMFGNTLTGLPMCRPLFINDPQDTALYNDKASFLDNEFFVGGDLLVAPVLIPQAENNNGGKRDVYLPAGSDWYCFMNNTLPLLPAVEGGTTVRDYDARLTLDGNHINFIVPLYVRAGAIIPTIELEQYTGERNAAQKPNPITLNIYPGSSGAYTMYLDDGLSRSSAPVVDPRYGGDKQARGEYRMTEIRHTRTGKLREISVNRVHDGYTPKYETYFYLAILHDPAETETAAGCLKSVSIGTQETGITTGGTPEQRSNALSALSGNGWYYNENIRISFIKVTDDNPLLKITLVYY